MSISCLLYITISLLGKRVEFDIDQMLHRGKYSTIEPATAESKKGFRKLLEKLGVTKEFSRRDKWTYAVCLGWSLFLFGVFIIGTIYNLFINRNVSDQTWLKFWYIWIIVSFAASVAVTIWLIIGGLKDMKKMFIRLSGIERNDSDDGTVVRIRSCESVEPPPCQ